MVTARVVAPAAWALYWPPALLALVVLFGPILFFGSTAVLLFNARMAFRYFQFFNWLGVDFSTGQYIVLGFNWLLGVSINFAVFLWALNRILAKNSTRCEIELMPSSPKPTTLEILNLGWQIYWRALVGAVVLGFVGGAAVGVVVAITRRIIGDDAALIPVLRTGGIIVSGCLMSFLALSLVLSRRIGKPVGTKVLAFRGAES